MVKAIWSTGAAIDAFFLADYEINPLGVKSDEAIAGVVKKWLGLAAQHSDTLLIACNTLSIRYSQLMQSRPLPPGLKHVISMVDCFESLVKTESEYLGNKRILTMGTEFTASQPVYPDILKRHLPAAHVKSVAATDLERKIARFQLDTNKKDSLLTPVLEQAIDDSEVTILACTCFPMVSLELKSRFPDVVFLDPGAYCAGLVAQHVTGQYQRLSIEVTGDVITKDHVMEFADSYLGPVLQ